MRPIRIRQGAAGFTQWIQLNRMAENFNVGLSAVLSSGASMTYSVQHTFDDIHYYVPCSISRTTTAATLTLAGHGLSVNDWVGVISSGSTNLDGGFNVASVVDANNITYTVANSGAAADTGSALVAIARVFNHLTLAAVTASGDGNYISPVEAVRLNITTYGSGFADLLILQGRG